MKKIDIFLQRERIKTTIPYIQNGMSVLDIGCSNGELFELYREKDIEISGIGLDPDIESDIIKKNYQLIKDSFPSSKVSGTFDVITALAVLEHISDEKIDEFIYSCKKHLKANGKVIITVPHPFVDTILKVLIFLKIIDGMEAEQHHGFDIQRVAGLFEKCGFNLLKHKRFQFGMNNLFVFSGKY